MNVFSETLSISASGLRAQSSRLNVVSQNIANTDTPGYRRKLTEFRQSNGVEQPAGAVDLARQRTDPAELHKVYDPNHPMADASGHYDGSNVDLIIEIADAREAQRSYEANLKAFDQVRSMADSLLDLIRR